MERDIVGDNFIMVSKHNELNLIMGRKEEMGKPAQFRPGESAGMKWTQEEMDDATRWYGHITRGRNLTLEQRAALTERFKSRFK